ncbi:MAG: hypothetical protein DBY37_02620 [Desulfovibrionaceae bacterium]|nr:MAG: hypothetical protein DBY37_02620 [Desulfovibrionaceae bacterium]
MGRLWIETCYNGTGIPAFFKENVWDIYCMVAPARQGQFAGQSARVGRVQDFWLPERFALENICRPDPAFPARRLHA